MITTEGLTQTEWNMWIAFVIGALLWAAWMLRSEWTRS